MWNNSKDAPGKNLLVLADKPFGQWNSFRIKMVGDRVTVYLNDKLVGQRQTRELLGQKKPLLTKARHSAQTHDGEIPLAQHLSEEDPAKSIETRVSIVWTSEVEHDAPASAQEISCRAGGVQSRSQ